ncbi:sigma-70 family RNA polymerase sigma factor [Anaerobacillus sp. CMMVII]|uniref:RNA polymerase sigma factor n=1 Tax=Anaerobacillus sp. CMMVII TaxID=2755588 RepID=UPI0021B800D3|nr:sigma-70 family RNA polymerase sigma factor [Anaerobacillus sp. CMMVII]MCT8136839.1 sigma-70 family RNA polymerase sigma factor [Anaerobacillus sp. CMMVII]
MKNSIIEDLYKKYYKTAYIYTFSLCKKKELTEDIVSGAFEKALLTLDEEKKHFKYWLLVVCKNIWIDHLKKHKKMINKAFTESNLIDQACVMEEIIQKEKNRRLYNCIMLLPENYQEILILHYYADIPLVEIEGLLKLSKANTKTLIYRARTKLKKVLEENRYEF